MNGYVCVYRHLIPRPRDWQRTASAAASHPLLRQFLDVYGDQNCFYDWGDDPSFFASTQTLGDRRDITWGACRSDVRRQLKAGDFVVFFCAKEDDKRGGWDYYYIGVRTVALTLTREVIWSDDHYAKYRSFFNILARLSAHGELEQHETFHRYHSDWKERCKAPYVVFADEQSQFNLVNPLHVATYTGTKGAVETWYSSRNQRVARLEASLLPQSSSTRRLRTSHSQHSHRHINLRSHLGRHSDLNDLRSCLIELATNSLRL